MKNVTKILTAVVLCTAVFASANRVENLGGNAAFWPGDEANIGAFPAQINNHGFVQLSGVGVGAKAGADMVFDHNGTAWGLSFSADPHDWVNLGWGNGTMGINVGLINSDTGANNGDKSGYTFSYGNTFDWGELGIHYASGDEVDYEGFEVDFRKACGWWVFTDMVAHIEAHDDDDTEIDVDWFTHWDASGADVMFAMGMEYDTDDGDLNQTAAIGVEANMTDWATVRAGVQWSYNLSGDDDVTGGDATAYTWSTGLGFNWGGFSGDMSISDSVFGDPVGYMTGNQMSGGLASGAVTLTYSF